MDDRIGKTPRYHGQFCWRTFSAHTGTSFAGHRWHQGILVTAVR